MNDDGLPLHFTVNKTIVDQDTQIPQPPHFVIDLYPWQKAAVERMRHTEEGKYKYDENEYAEYGTLMGQGCVGQGWRNVYLYF